MMRKVERIALEIRHRLQPLKDLRSYRIRQPETSWMSAASVGPSAKKRPVFLLTCGFGSDRYARAAHRLAEQGRQTGFFDRVIVLTSLAEVPGIDAATFECLHTLAVQFPRGYGLWAWKPAVVAAVMQTLPEGAALFYLDAGCEISAFGRRRFDAYLAQLDEHANLFFSIPLEEYHWTAASVLAHFGLDRRDRSPQIQATWFAVVNDLRSRELIRRWAHECVANDARWLRARDDDPASELIEHREDQSVLSCLLKGVAWRNVVRWEDNFSMALYCPNSWILLMPVHTLRSFDATSRLQPLLNASSLTACNQDAITPAAVPLRMQVRVGFWALRQVLFCTRAALRAALRIMLERDPLGP